jgi:glutamate-1-semialdehyde aminotransferase/2-polyprenyl-3-methyl-5-hydroxy-6-metoxy-1,4-benzoquinol methylase
MKVISDREIEDSYLRAAASEVQWCPGSSSVEDGWVTVTGWAITLKGKPENSQFLANGVPFDRIQYPIPSPDIANIYWNIPAAANARFAGTFRLEAEKNWHDGFICLEFRDDSGPEHSKRRAWYLPDPETDLPVPDEAKIHRIGVTSTFYYQLGGAAIYKRLEHYLRSTFSRTFADFPDILEWPCGCGRVTRNFRWSPEVRVSAVDIDRDSIEWCQRHLPHAKFIKTNPQPPLPFPDESFDLVLVVSLLSHLREDDQLAWLQELKRVARKDALLLASIPGPTQVGLARPPASLVRDIAAHGFLITGRNPDLDDVMPEQTHYVSGLFARDYVRASFARHFKVMDIVDAIVANDDLIVMKKDTGTTPATPAEDTNPYSTNLRDYDLNPYIHPTTGKYGYGGHLVDIEGRDYVDFMSAWGTNLLGYGYNKVTRAIIRQARRFTNIGIPYPQFWQFRDLFRSFVPSGEDVRYGKNGSDVCAGAVRLARHLTNREKILYHGYHGFHDWFFASTDCPGIPNALRGTILPQENLTPAAVSATLRKYPGEIAALILNPILQPVPTADEMQETIEVLHRHGALVIFDEMLSGFRVAPGGMQELWNVKPDLSCFGKAIANGMPLSVLCGSGKYITRLPETCYGMTFEGEAVSLAAAYATLTELRERDVIGNLYRKGNQIRKEYRRLARTYGISTDLAGYEPCMSLEFQDHGTVSRRELFWLMNQQLCRNGIFTFGAFVLCFSHTSRDLRKLRRAFDLSMQVLRKAVDQGTTEGLLDERIRLAMGKIQSPGAWRQVNQST